MNCPLFELACLLKEELIHEDGGECIGDNCAWWDEDKGACSVKVIARELTNIQIKMPYEGQFRR